MNDVWKGNHDKWPKDGRVVPTYINKFVSAINEGLDNDYLTRVTVSSKDIGHFVGVANKTFLRGSGFRLDWFNLSVDEEIALFYSREA